MQILVRTSDRLILQYGQSLPPAGAGQALEEVPDATRDALLAAYEQPSGGIILSADHREIAVLPYEPGPADDIPDLYAELRALRAEVEALKAAR